MIRHLKFPTTLYRLQNSLRFKLKPQDPLNNKKSFEYTPNEHGLYVPRKQTTQNPQIIHPNGVQLFSMGENFLNILKSPFKLSPRYYYVVQISEGTPLPESTVLLQDPTQESSYWLETQLPVQAKQFNSKIELLLLQSKIYRKKDFKQLVLPQYDKKVQDDKTTLP